jgi:hypothetical protein
MFYFELTPEEIAAKAAEKEALFARWRERSSRPYVEPILSAEETREIEIKCMKMFSSMMQTFSQ